MSILIDGAPYFVGLVFLGLSMSIFLATIIFLLRDADEMRPR